MCVNGRGRSGSMRAVVGASHLSPLDVHNRHASPATLGMHRFFLDLQRLISVCIRILEKISYRQTLHDETVRILLVMAQWDKVFGIAGDSSGGLASGDDLT